jgi:hypothetical protein
LFAACCERVFGHLFVLPPDFGSSSPG